MILTEFLLGVLEIVSPEGCAEAEMFPQYGDRWAGVLYSVQRALRVSMLVGTARWRMVPYLCTANSINGAKLGGRDSTQ